AAMGPAARVEVVITRAAPPRSIGPLNVSALLPRIVKLLATEIGLEIVRAPADALMVGSLVPARPTVPIVKVPVPTGPERIVVPELTVLVPRFSVPVRTCVPP